MHSESPLERAPALTVVVGFLISAALAIVGFLGSCSNFAVLCHSAVQFITNVELFSFPHVQRQLDSVIGLN